MLRAVPQDRRGRPTRSGAPPASAPEHPLLAVQRGAGNAAIARALLARRFDQAAFDKAHAERERFMASRFEHKSWRPSTHRGNFDVLYEPKSALLTVTVKCKFWFRDGNPAQWADTDEAGPEAHMWKPDEILKWKADFLRLVSAKWSDTFTFFHTRPWWEDVQAAVQ